MAPMSADTAPAAMPGVEVATDLLDTLQSHLATVQNALNGAAATIDRLTARALAAEAALAAERERCAKIAEDYGCRARASRQPSTMTDALVVGCEHIAAAIRAEGE